MAGVQEAVVSKFLERLSNHDLVSDRVVGGLSELLAHGGIPKADVVIEVIVDGSGDSVS